MPFFVSNFFNFVTFFHTCKERTDQNGQHYFLRRNKRMRNLTNQLVALLLAFVTVCSLSLAIVSADNKKEDETSQSEAQVVIQTYQIKTDETTENSESASFLNLFNKRL
jgi:hypothetical protein